MRTTTIGGNASRNEGYGNARPAAAAGRAARTGATALLLLLGGCWGGGMPLHPVAGVVKVDGKPIEGAGVGFHPEKGPVGSATTGKDGKFVIGTANKLGALVGKYRISVVKSTIVGLNADETIAPGGIKTVWIVPEKYASPDTSDLTFEVKPGTNEVPLDLKSKP